MSLISIEQFEEFCEDYPELAQCYSIYVNDDDFEGCSEGCTRDTTIEKQQEIDALLAKLDEEQEDLENLNCNDRYH